MGMRERGEKREDSGGGRDHNWAHLVTAGMKHMIF